jgi:hypothetical protein
MALKLALSRANAMMARNNADIWRIYHISMVYVAEFYGKIIPQHAKIKAVIRRLKAALKK